MFLVGLASLIVSMGVTWAVTPLVIRLAHGLGAVDHPGGRKTHTRPIPRIGGVAVFLGFLAGLTFAAFATGNPLEFPRSGVYWQGLAIAAAGLFAVGLIDDLWGLSFRWKFAAQIAAAAYTWQCGFRIEAISHPLGGTLELGWFSFPITLLWVVGITNAVNLIDGLDGLAAGIALITTSVVAVIALQRGLLGVTAASVALAGSLVGFLRFNFNPARIFLGDSGSLFLGFVLAVISVRGSHKGPTAVAVFVPLMVLALPLLDTGLAVVRRVFSLSSRGMRSKNKLRYLLKNYQHVFMPDRGHIHHRLLDVGMSHRGAVLVLYAVGGAFALSAFVLVAVRSLWVAALLLGVLSLSMATFLVLLYFGSRRVAQEKRAPEAPEPQGQIAGARSISLSGSQLRR